MHLRSRPSVLPSLLFLVLLLCASCPAAAQNHIHLNDPDLNYIVNHPSLAPVRYLVAKAIKPFITPDPKPQIAAILPFLPDEPHPWLLANAPRLSRLPKEAAAAQLCDVTSELWMGDQPPPVDVFADIEVSTNRKGGGRAALDRSSWDAAGEALDALGKCPAALEGARRVKVDLYVSGYQEASGRFGEPEAPDEGDSVPGRVAGVLGGMKGMEELVIGVIPEYAGLFSRVMEEDGVRFAGVRKLTPGRGMEAVVGMCPNLEELVGGSYEHHWSWNYHRYLHGVPEGRVDLVRAAGEAARKKGGRVEGPGRLRTLRIRSTNTGWGRDGLLEGLLSSMVSPSSRGGS